MMNAEKKLLSQNPWHGEPGRVTLHSGNIYSQRKIKQETQDKKIKVI